MHQSWHSPRVMFPQNPLLSLCEGVTTTDMSQPTISLHLSFSLWRLESSISRAPALGPWHGGSAYLFFFLLLSCRHRLYLFHSGLTTVPTPFILYCSKFSSISIPLASTSQTHYHHCLCNTLGLWWSVWRGWGDFTMPGLNLILQSQTFCTWFTLSF